MCENDFVNEAIIVTYGDRTNMIKLASYQILALLGSSLLVASGVMRFIQTASLKELFVGILYFIANIIIFCL